MAASGPDYRLFVEYLFALFTYNSGMVTLLVWGARFVRARPTDGVLCGDAYAGYKADILR